MSLIPGTGMVDTIKGALIGIAVGLILGGIAGWVVKDKFFKAEKVEQVQATIKDDGKTVTEAQKKGEKLAKENHLLRSEIDILRDKLKGAIPPTPINSPAEDSNANCPAVASARLTVYAVGLLNRAISPASPDPEGWSDEEKRALEAAGLREVSDKLTEIAGKYRELAKNHDALVDDVADYQKKVEQIRKQAAKQ